MMKYYISSKQGKSGICKYSDDFFELILKEKEYVYIDSEEDLTNILAQVSPADHAHIEIGIFQRRELRILIEMLNRNYKNIAITLHDPPLLKYPYLEFSNSFANNVSKFYDLYINRLNDSKKLIKKIKTIYVLSLKGEAVMKRNYRVNNVYYMPHIINEKDICMSSFPNSNFIYLGFIGKNKGLEYSLKLHQSLLSKHPDIQFYIVGMSIGKEKRFYQYLKDQYKHNVHYLGYIPDEELKGVLEKTTFSLMPFKDYKFFAPMSGSLLYSLKKGKIPFTTKVNAVDEIVDDGVTGYFLTGKISDDLSIISGILNKPSVQNEMRIRIQKELLFNHTSPAVNKKFKIPI